MQYLPNSPITDTSVGTVIDSFDLVLSDLPIEDIAAATKQYLSVGTFFPTPGKLRETAMDLQLLAIGVPTSTEAWGMVCYGLKADESIFCEAGAELRNEYIAFQSADTMALYTEHVKACEVCHIGVGYVEKYDHSAVAETVRLLGGRDVILTNNAVSDRARFIEAYREVVARERMRTAMLPEVRLFVEAKKHNQLQAGISGLAKQLSGGAK